MPSWSRPPTKAATHSSVKDQRRRAVGPIHARPRRLGSAVILRVNWPRESLFATDAAITVRAHAPTWKTKVSLQSNRTEKLSLSFFACPLSRIERSECRAPVHPPSAAEKTTENISSSISRRHARRAAKAMGYNIGSAIFGVLDGNHGKHHQSLFSYLTDQLNELKQTGHLLQKAARARRRAGRGVYLRRQAGY